MLVLAVDTSTPTVLAAVVELGPAAGPQTMACRRTVDARAHAEVLTPQVLQCLAEVGATPAALDAVVCGTGPGPYTGLRVGMMTAVAFGDALGIPVHGVCSLDAIAGDTGHDGPLLVVTDARRKEVYWARYAAGVRVEGPGVVRPGELDPGEATAVAGSPKHAALFDRAVIGPDSPDPTALVRLAASDLLSSTPPEPMVPLYLRRPDAVATVDRTKATSR
ncbi:MAG: tRNA (adenosine(37)-N6)-threonylcarbamoyltransferase complex dimerization subunit type 1 TsaB [Mycobacteriaceae bacterium]